MLIKEKLLKEYPTIQNRIVLQQAKIEVKGYLHYEEQFWRQKTGITWFENGDRNTRYFYSFVRGRKLLQLNRIKVIGLRTEI